MAPSFLAGRDTPAPLPQPLSTPRSPQLTLSRPALPGSARSGSLCPARLTLLPLIPRLQPRWAASAEQVRRSLSPSLTPWARLGRPGARGTRARSRPGAGTAACALCSRSAAIPGSGRKGGRGGPGRSPGVHRVASTPRGVISRLCSALVRHIWMLCPGTKTTRSYWRGSGRGHKDDEGSGALSYKERLRELDQFSVE